jgi:hypothetical protein
MPPASGIISVPRMFAEKVEFEQSTPVGAHHDAAYWLPDK